MGTSFEAELRRPADLQGEASWAFILLPKSESDRFPRRGRNSVQGAIDGHPFTATLEPDGQLSHWLKLSHALLNEADISGKSTVTLEVAPCDPELEPQLPRLFSDALFASPQAKASWDATTTIARIDWVHWIESAKQAATRAKRITAACDMLASGKKRVCCFDQSGYYSKSLSAPREAP